MPCQKIFDGEDVLGMEAEECKRRRWWDEEILTFRANEARMTQKSVHIESSSSNWSPKEPRSSSKQVRRNSPKDDVPKRKKF